MRKQFSRTDTKGSVGTLARGLDILELFTANTPELTQKEISETLGLPVPTVHRLTKLLMERGWLVRDAAGRRLRLGLAPTRLLPGLLAGLRLPDVARDHLRDLAERTGETVNLAVLHEGEVAYLASESGSRLLTLKPTVGLRLPVHCTALGKCLLAQLSDEDARRTAGRQPYRALTSHTLTSWAELRENLERIRNEGVAVSHEEYEDGLDSMAVPIAWIEGEGPLALNVSLPSSRAAGGAEAELTRELAAAAAAIERAAGVPGGSRPFAGQAA
jgi:DNA-binding IclR family transcriptional regulator